MYGSILRKTALYALRRQAPGVRFVRGIPFRRFFPASQAAAETVMCDDLNAVFTELFYSKISIQFLKYSQI